MYLNMLWITIVIVGIFYSGFPDEIERIINRYLAMRGKRSIRIPKPFSCQLCMTWWCTLIYVLLKGRFSILNICVCLMFALSTGVIESILTLFLTRLEDFFRKLI